MAEVISRRSFLTATVALPTAGIGFAGPSASFREPARDVPLGGEYDAIVVGAGPAGIAAAVTAARRGRKVLLLEKAASVGGVWTSGLVSCVMDGGKAALSRELASRLDSFGARLPRQAMMRAENYLFEPEYMKLVLEAMLSESHVDFLTASPACAAYRDASGKRLETVVAESESGRTAYRAGAFVDASGDGALGALAGCGFDSGGPDGPDADQPASLCALVTVGDSRRIARYIVNDASAFDASGRPVGNRKKELHRAVVSCGFNPSFARPALFRLNGNVLMLLSNHEYGLRIGDVRAVTEATCRARRELAGMIAALAAKGGDDWAGVRLVACAARPWNRRSRRLHGLYTLTADDVASGRTFPDAVARSFAPIDVHALSAEASRRLHAGAPAGCSFKPFDIPLRACRSRDLENLYMAGRCISGDFVAHASYRMSGTAFAVGEAVGKVL